MSTGGTLLMALGTGAVAGFAGALAVVAARARRRRGTVSVAAQRERCAAFVTAMERWLAVLSADARSADRGLVEERCDEAHLAFARMELVVPERIRFAGRLWLDDALAAYRAVTEGPPAGVAAHGPALHRLIDRATAGRHDFYLAVRAELGPRLDSLTLATVG